MLHFFRFRFPAGSSSSSVIPLNTSGGKLVRMEFNDDLSSSALSSITGDWRDYSTEAHRSESKLVRRIPLCGRTSERTKLLSLFAKVSRGDGKSQVVLVRGSSGSGKSALIESLRETITPGHDKRIQASFVSGKFDQYSGRNEPFSAIVSAISDLIELIAQRNRSHLYEEQVKEAIKDQETTFASLIPNLALITGTSYEVTTLKTHHAMAYYQFKTAFNKLLIALTGKAHPLIMFLDDLQWMDDASQELLQFIISESTAKHLLLIGAMRDGDPCTEQVIETLLAHDESTGSFDETKRGGLALTRIELGNLDERSVVQMLSAALGMPMSSCSSLGTLVHKKTIGNPFAVLRFLELVESEGHIENKGGTWSWESSKIEAETNVSENVLEVVERLLGHLPDRLRDLLVLAAFLGFEFEETVLAGLASQTYVERKDTEPLPEQKLKQQINKLLTVACNEGVIELLTWSQNERHQELSSSKYKFSHDKIQQAFYDSIKMAESRQLHRTIGLFLLRGRSSSSGAAFEAANHLNQAQPLLMSSPEERPLLLNANYEAAKLAISRAAYPLAVRYLQFALSAQDPEEKWRKDYQLTLEMSTSLFEMYAACGQNDDVELVIDDVLSNAKSFEDVFPVMSTKVCILGSTCRYQEAVQYGREALTRLGEKVPRKPNVLQLLILLAKVRRWFRRLSDDDIMALPLVTDEKVKTVIRIYTRVAMYSSMTNKTLPLSIYYFLTATRLSFIHGIATATPGALCFLGFAEFSLGNLDIAVRCGRLAIRLAEDRDLGPEALAQAYSICSSNLVHWFEPSGARMVELARRGMLLGVPAGEFEWGYYSGLTIVMLEIANGVPLVAVEKHAREVCGKMKEFKMQGNIYMVCPCWQYCLNMMGRSENWAILTGEGMDEEEFRSDPVVKQSDGHQALLTSIKLQLAVLFGNEKEMEELATAMQKQEKTLGPLFLQYDIKLCMGLVWYRCARATDVSRRKARYLKKARKVVEHMKKMKSAGCPNFDDTMLLLKAEDASCDGARDQSTVRALYDEAIAGASEKLHHEAIANELAAVYQFHHHNHLIGRVYLDRALSKYNDLNAYAKVDHLEAKFGSMGEGDYVDTVITGITLCVEVEPSRVDE